MGPGPGLGDGSPPAGSGVKTPAGEGLGRTPMPELYIYNPQLKKNAFFMQYRTLLK